MADLISMLAACAGGGEKDPDFNQTVLLLHGDGTNGAQNNTFLDGSTNNFTITRNGNTTQGTFSPFSAEPGKWGNFFDGTTDWLSVADNAAFTLGVSDFTIECWLYSTNTGVRQFFAGQIASTGLNSSASFFLQKSSTNKLVGIVCSGSTSYTATSTNDLPLNSWTHVALVRDGNTLRQYINGVQDGTASITGITINDSSEILAIGRAGNLAVDHWFGYISNFRQVVGTCLYLNGTTFTPPTTPLTNITNTSLLTCQSNRFVDNGTANSGTGFTITRNGDVRVTPFSPFAPTAAYSAGTNGGSGYFDGSGDFLTFSSISLSSDFTLEAWVYKTGSLKGQIIGNTSVNFQFAINATQNVEIYNGATSYLSTGTITLNAWNHVAVTRAGTTLRMFINGTLSGTHTDSATLSFNAISDILGFDRFLGYLSSIRIVSGTAVYTAAFTPPTAPLTAITNTQLLLNFTNAGIIDNTGKNNLETVGNAQIDTTTKKYGTGSLEFDGTDDYLITQANPLLALGTEPFTVEFWAYPRTTSDNDGVFTFGGSSSGLAVSIFSNTWNATTAGSGGTAMGAATPNAWIHIALVRETNGGVIKFYKNGVYENQLANANLTDNQLKIGYYFSSSFAYDGFIDDFRITKGVARYTANFTPPTAAFPNE